MGTFFSSQRPPGIHLNSLMLCFKSATQRYHSLSASPLIYLILSQNMSWNSHNWTPICHDCSSSVITKSLSGIGRCLQRALWLCLYPLNKSSSFFFNYMYNFHYTSPKIRTSKHTARTQYCVDNQYIFVFCILRTSLIPSTICTFIGFFN